MQVCDVALRLRCIHWGVGGLVCTAVSSLDKWEIFKMCHLIIDKLSDVVASASTHRPSFAFCALTECFLMSFSLFDLNQALFFFWKAHARQEVNTRRHIRYDFLARTVSVLSGKCISSCQHFCSLLDWALCSAVTPLQEASSSP